MDPLLNVDAVPDPLIKRTSRDLQEVLAAATHSELPPEAKKVGEASPLALAVIAVVLSVIAWIIAELSNYMEIKKNWATYRCMPSVMPFAAFYGQNLGETMRFCTGEAVREHAPGVIDPIIAGINKATGVVEGVYDEVTEISGGITDLMKGFENFVVGFMNSFRLIGTRVRMTFVRMKSLFDRVYGVFLSFSFAAISAITFGQNMVCNPMVTFMGEITGVDTCCFAPNTMVRMADGSTKELHLVRIGDRLMGDEDPCIVTGTFQFDGREVPMVFLKRASDVAGDGVVVSGNHRMLDRGRWVRADSLPWATPCESLTTILCLNTSTNQIVLGDGSVFTDYEETEDPVVVRTAKRLAEWSLNGGDLKEEKLNEGELDYSLGIDPALHVILEDGSWCPIRDVRLGDRLKEGATVTGIVEELVDATVKIGGTEYLVGAAQFVKQKEGTQWTRAAALDTTGGPSKRLRHLFTSTGSFWIAYHFFEAPFVWQVRDYTEVSGPLLQIPYDAYFQ